MGDPAVRDGRLDRATRRARSRALPWIAFLAIALPAHAAGAGERGFNAPVDLLDSRADLKRLRDAGATLVRLDFARMPLMPQDPPYTFDAPETRAAWRRFHETIGWADSLGLHVVIDPHAMPGALEHTTVRSGDPFWNDDAAQSALLALWRRIAREGERHGDVIAGYDLVNEPFGIPDDPKYDLNWIYRRLIEEVRAIDPTVDFYLEFHAQHFWDVSADPAYIAKGTDYIARGPDHYGGDLPGSRILYSPHLYWPLEYTHQGVYPDRMPAGQTWPDPSRFDVRGDGTPDPKRPWTEAGMREYLKGVIRFAEREDVGHDRIYVGEFSTSFCPECGWDANLADATPGRAARNGADDWLASAVRIFDEYGWDWTYHAANGSDLWNAHVPARREEQLRYLLDPPPR